MTLPLICVLLMVVVTYLSKIPVMVAMARLGGYDNKHPRDQQARLTGWGRRALAAHQNSFEVFPVFAACVFVGQLSHGDPRLSGALAVLFVVSRLAYIGLYIGNLDRLRSLMWFVGIFSAMAIGLAGACNCQH